MAIVVFFVGIQGYHHVRKLKDLEFASGEGILEDQVAFPGREPSSPTSGGGKKANESGQTKERDPGKQMVGEEQRGKEEKHNVVILIPTRPMSEIENQLATRNLPIFPLPI